MKIAIIGATSFLGKTLCSILRKEKGDILLLSRTQPEGEAQWCSYNYPQNLLDYTILATCDVIYYCAGAGIQPKHSDSEQLIYEMNAFEPIRLFNALKGLDYKGKLVTFGSYFEIGNASKAVLYTANQVAAHSNILPNAYCKAKALLSSFLRKEHLGQLDFTHQHLYLTNIYGAEEYSERLIPYIIQTAKSGQTLSFTSGVQERQYTHIRDIATYLATSKNDKSSGLFNLTDETMVSVRQVIECVLEQVKKRYNIVPDCTFGTQSKRDVSMQFLGLDMTKERNSLDFEPTVSLEEGISEYLDFYEN